MSEAKALIQKAKDIRERLIHPPNAVIDDGIDLKRKPITRIPSSALSPYPVPTEEPVSPIGYLQCRNPGNITFNAILKAVADHFNISVMDIRGRDKRKEICLPRHIAVYLGVNHTKRSGTALAIDLKRDHSTGIHSINTIKRLLLTDENLVAVVKSIEGKLFAGHYDRPPLAAQPKVRHPHDY